MYSESFILFYTIVMIVVSTSTGIAIGIKIGMSYADNRRQKLEKEAYENHYKKYPRESS